MGSCKVWYCSQYTLSGSRSFVSTLTRTFESCPCLGPPALKLIYKIYLQIRRFPRWRYSWRWWNLNFQNTPHCVRWRNLLQFCHGQRIRPLPSELAHPTLHSWASFASKAHQRAGSVARTWYAFPMAHKTKRRVVICCKSTQHIHINQFGCSLWLSLKTSGRCHSLDPLIHVLSSFKRRYPQKHSWIATTAPSDHKIVTVRHYLFMKLANHRIWMHPLSI